MIIPGQILWKHSVRWEGKGLVEEGLSGRPYEGMKEAEETMEDDGKADFG